MNSGKNIELTTICVNNKVIDVRKDVPVGAALYEKGILGFRKSFKYNRLRGLYVFDWWGPERIGVKNGLESNPYLLKVRAGLELKCDCGIGILSRFIWMLRRYFGVGFYNNMFFRSSFGWGVMKRMLNKILPYHYPPYEKSLPKSYVMPIEIDADVLVIGGGLAGLSSSIASSTYDLKTVLVEADERLGGYVDRVSADISLGDDENYRNIEDLVKVALKNNVHILNSVVFQGFLEDAIVGMNLRTGQIIFFKPKSIVLASGSREVPALFENNDLPGILFATALLRLTKEYDVELGGKGLIIGFSDLGFRTAVELRRRGVDITIVDKNKVGGGGFVSKAMDLGINIIDEVRGIKALGAKKVEKVVVESKMDKHTFDVDFIGLASYANPSIELPGQLGIKMAFDTRIGGFIPIHSWDGVTEERGVFIAGSLGGAIPIDSCYYLSKAVGYAAAEYASNHSLNEDYENALSIGKEYLRKEDLNKYRAYEKLVESYYDGGIYSHMDEKDVNTWYEGDPTTEFVCMCTDVTVSDLIRMNRELGMWRMELVKRYSGLGTGACQGRGCIYNAVVIISRLSGKKPIEIGRFRSRFPVIPIKLENLAGVRV